MTSGATSSAQPAQSGSGEPHGPGPANGAGARILVIDDSLTILKVVQMILEMNGYQVAVARDGAEGFDQLRAAGPFDLVLLDFVMPRMNGYQFCRQLRADEQHKQLPVVLMSARTNTIGARFVEQTGAVDALDKPFDARALIAVVANVISKGGDGEQRHMPSPEMMVDEDELSWDAVDEPPPSRHYHSMNRVSALLAQALGPVLSRMRPQDLSQPDLVSDTIAHAMTGDLIEDIVEAADDMEVESTEMLRGELAKMPLAEVLQLLQLRRQTGLMRVRHQRMSMTLSIRQGMLDLAQSFGTGDEFRIGRYFVEAGLMTREEMESGLAKKPAGVLLGEYFLEQGKIDEMQLRYALAKQSSELVYEVLRWPDGRFKLLEEPFPPEAEKAQLALGLSELVLEGFRRVDEWRLMADTINFEAVLVVDQVALGTLDDSKIGANERPVLMAINGMRTAREVMEVSELASFDAIKAIYRFLQSRIVREKVPGKSSQHSLSAIDGEVKSDAGFEDSHHGEPEPEASDKKPAKKRRQKKAPRSGGAISEPAAEDDKKSASS